MKALKTLLTDMWFLNLRDGTHGTVKGEAGDAVLLAFDESTVQKTVHREEFFKGRYRVFDTSDEMRAARGLLMPALSVIEGIRNGREQELLSAD